MAERRIIFGMHAVGARLRQNSGSLSELYILDTRHDARIRNIVDKARAAGVRIIPADAARLDSLCGHARHQGVVAVYDAAKSYVALDDVLDTIEHPPLLLILDGVTDPHNLGACLRVADAMGADAVIAPKDRSAGLTAAACKVACGAAETVPYIMVTNLSRTLRELKERGIWIVGTDVGGRDDLFSYTVPREGVAWVMGAEDTGMRRLTRENCDVLVSIPMFGSVQSLNVSVSAGMVLAETRRQWHIVPPSDTK